MSSRRIVVLTDLHLRSDALPGFLNKQLETCFRLVDQKPADAVVINGDIFHHRNPRSQEIIAFRDFLSSINTKQIIINRGNHDTLRKDGSSESILRVYSDIAEVVIDTRTIEVAGMPIDFIPHYEDEDQILDSIKSCESKIMFGHFGYNRCAKYGGYFYKSKIRKSHMKNISLLGHIHTPKDDGNVYIIGTAYSNSFHEANQIKKSCDIILYKDQIDVIRKPVDFGIRHIQTTIDKIEEFDKKYKFKDFFTVLRVKLDKLDSFSVQKIKEDILTNYSIRHLDFDFDDMLPKTPMELSNVPSLITIDDKVIEDYIKNSKTIFSSDELWEALKEIRDASE